MSSSYRPVVVLSFVAPLVLACGGTTSTDAGPLADAAPAYQALALDLTSSDVAAGASLVAAPGGSATALTASTDLCHPHLFLRTDAVAMRMNRHLYKFLGLVEAVVQTNPTLATADSVTWQRTRGTVVVKFTVSRSAASPTLHGWLLELRPALSPAAPFTTVFTGTIDRTGATRPHDGSGTMSLDLSALHSVLPLEPASGVITASFQLSATSRTIAVDASGVTWDTAGITDGLLATAPRTARYVYTHAPGKGGSLKIQDQMPFYCPSNPTGVAADVSLVARWYRTATGAVHGRSDARMAGGQLPAGERVVGVTCSESSGDGADFGERFWLMKEEDAAGATVPGLAFLDTHGLPACDPALGATVPSLTDDTGDFDFSTIDFSSPAPYPFPKI